MKQDPIPFPESRPDGSPVQSSGSFLRLCFCSIFIPPLSVYILFIANKKLCAFKNTDKILNHFRWQQSWVKWKQNQLVQKKVEKWFISVQNAADNWSRVPVRKEDRNCHYYGVMPVLIWSWWWCCFKCLQCQNKSLAVITCVCPGRRRKNSSRWNSAKFAGQWLPWPRCLVNSIVVALIPLLLRKALKRNPKYVTYCSQNGRCFDCNHSGW